jgi:hypothetical protein
LIGQFINHIWLYNPRDLQNPPRENFINLLTHKKDDLSIEEYEKYYWEVLKQSLSVQGLDRTKYFIKGEKCAYKIMEEIIRNEN